MFLDYSICFHTTTYRCIRFDKWVVKLQFMHTMDRDLDNIINRYLQQMHLR